MKLSAKSGLAETGFVYSAQIVTILAGIAVQGCLAWFLGPADRGSYAVCLIFGHVMGVLSCLGIDGALQYCVASNKMDVSQGVSVAISLHVVCSLLGVIIGFGLLELDLEFFTKSSRQAFMVALLYIPVSMLDAIFTKLFVGLREFRCIGVFSLIKGCLNLVNIVVALHIFSSGVAGALSAIIIGWTMTIILEAGYIHKKYHLRLQLPMKRQVVEVLNYGKRFYFTRLGNVMNFQIGIVILAFFVSSSDIGFYAVATKLIAYIIIIPDAVGNVLLPRIAVSKDGRFDLVAQCSRICGVVCGLAIIILLCVIKPLVLILFSSSFLSIIPLVWLLAPGVFIRCATKIMISYFNGTNHPEISSLATIAGVTTNLILLLCLLPSMGLKGGALAMSIGYTVNSVILFVNFLRLSGIPLMELILLRKSDLAFLGLSKTRAKG